MFLSSNDPGEWLGRCSGFPIAIVRIRNSNYWADRREDENKAKRAAISCAHLDSVFTWILIFIRCSERIQCGARARGSECDPPAPGPRFAQAGRVLWPGEWLRKCGIPADRISLCVTGQVLQCKAYRYVLLVRITNADAQFKTLHQRLDLVAL